jgi:hypothetical protein
MAKSSYEVRPNQTKTLSAKNAKYTGRLIDLARAERVAGAKHGRPWSFDIRAAEGVGRAKRRKQRKNAEKNTKA